MASYHKKLLICLGVMNLLSANQVYFEKKDALAPNMGTFNLVHTFDLLPLKIAVLELVNITTAFLDSDLMKNYETSNCHLKNLKVMMKNNFDRKNKLIYEELHSIFDLGNYFVILSDISNYC